MLPGHLRRRSSPRSPSGSDAAYREEGDFRERLVAALTVFMELVVSEPAAARLAAVESLTLGAAGVAPSRTRPWKRSN